MSTKYGKLFKNKNYCKDLASTVVNRFGDSVDAIASSWIVYELTGQAAWSAIIYAINRLPTIFVTPLVGPWVENHCKKNIMIITDIIRAICVGIMATGLMMGFLNAPLIGLLSLVISTAEAFRSPAGTAMFPMIVDKESYNEAISLNTSISSITELVGTGMAAAIIALIGSSGAIYLDMVTFILSALFIAWMKLPKEELKKEATASVSGYIHELKDGFKYCAGKKILVVFAFVALFLNGILVPINSLQTPIMTEVLKGGPELLSIMGITITVSTLLGSLLFPSIRKFLTGKASIIMMIGLIVMFYIGLVAAQPLYEKRFGAAIVLIVLCASLGFGVALGNMYISVEMFNVIDKSYLARVSGIGGAISCAITPVAAFIIGIVVKFTSTQTILIIAGIIAFLFGIYMLTTGSKAIEEAEAEMKQKNAQSKEMADAISDTEEGHKNPEPVC